VRGPVRIFGAQREGSHPRTYVRVADDSANAPLDSTAVGSVLATQTGASNTPRDIVITNGPMLTVTIGDQPAIGRTISSLNTSVTATVRIVSPDWAELDTLEVFANTTPGAPPRTGDLTLAPLQCFTSRPLGTIGPTEPCARARLAPQSMNVSLVSVGGGFRRFEATTTITLAAADILTRPGATGRDAWLVFRVRGNSAVFPVLYEGVYDDTTRDVLLGGDLAMIRTALTGRGPNANVITAPVFVDFDGGGYRAPFAP
jgi:hypothetical protein